MRVHDRQLKADETLPMYEADTRLGTVVKCTCGERTTLVHPCTEADDKCEHCKKVFVYRPWWGW